MFWDFTRSVFILITFLPFGLSAVESFSVSDGGFSAPYFNFTDSDGQTRVSRLFHPAPLPGGDLSIQCQWSIHQSPLHDWGELWGYKLEFGKWGFFDWFQWFDHRNHSIRFQW